MRGNQPNFNYKGIKSAVTSAINSKPRKKDWVAIIISLIAIGISVITLYFQFFYVKYNLMVSIVDATFEDDSTLMTKVIYHNKGNQHSTILQNTLYFYQDSVNIENKGFSFSSSKPVITYKDEYDPIVLTPGQQIYKNIAQPINFRSLNYESLDVNPKKNIKIAIKIGYIDETGLHSEKIIPIGWLKLDSTFIVKYWSIDFTTQILGSDSHYSRRYVTSQ